MYNFSANTEDENNKTNMMSVFFISNIHTTFARRSKSRNRQKLKKSARSFARRFWKSVGFSRILNKGRETERPTNSIFLYSTSKSFQKVARRLHEGKSLKIHIFFTMKRINKLKIFVSIRRGKTIIICFI